MTRRPTHADIMWHINRKLGEDFDRTGYDGPELPVPARVARLMKEAVTEAFEEASKEEAA